MSVNWFEEYSFETDPYYLHGPWVTPLNEIVWNRDDLALGKIQVDSFIEEIAKGYNTSLVIWGPWRSGKSWLARYIQKNIQDQEEVFFIPIIIEEGDPSLNAFFEQFMSRLIDTDWITSIARKIPDSQKRDKWKEYFELADLGQCLYNIFTDEEKILSKEWLIGNKLSVADMKKIGVQSNLDSLYKQMDSLKIIIRKSHSTFKNFILCIDQLESARGRNARLISDLLRELTSSFYDKFTLILILTIDTISQWFEFGYTEALLERVRYKVEMELLKYDYIPKFLRLQHEAHRTEQPSGSRFSPFSKKSILYLSGQMLPERIFPNFLLNNCGRLAREILQDRRRTITPNFIDSNLGLLQDIIKKTGQLRFDSDIP